MRSTLTRLVPIATALVTAGCSAGSAGSSPASGTAIGTATDIATSQGARLVATVGGFTRPEAVRYDPEQDVYFVSNWGTGATGDKDDNGFVSRMRADGTVDSLRFIAGGRGATLHSPRGMTIVGDTLWMADADAVRGFHRRTGAPLATVDFSAYRLGFLNDVAAGPDALYVTDTGTDHIYRIAGGAITVALQDSALGRPNGITRDAANERFVVVPFGGASVVRAWRPGGPLTDIGTLTGGAQLDGVEMLPGGRVLVASQRDSSLHLVTNGVGRVVARTGGRPADIAVDTRRNRVAVPFVARDLVEIWQLP